MTLPPHPRSPETDDQLFGELHHLYEVRLDTLRHASDQAVTHSTSRIVELETEYLKRFPDREVSPARLRPAGPGRTDDGERR